MIGTDNGTISVVKGKPNSLEEWKREADRAGKKAELYETGATIAQIVLVATAIINPIWGLAILGSGCAKPNTPEEADPWETLVARNEQWGGQTGCWEGWNAGGSPGYYYEFRDKGGLDLDQVHPQQFAIINENGTLTPPGYQDEDHQGQNSTDYTQMIEQCRSISDHGFAIQYGLFIHNFETVSQAALENFFVRLSEDLKGIEVDSIVFIPAWDIQGEWPAWPEGATRDCFIDTASFGGQMAVFKAARDNVCAGHPDRAYISLAVALGEDVTNRGFNRFGYNGLDYHRGLSVCDWIGANYYPGKVGSANDPAWAFRDFRNLIDIFGAGKRYAIYEYAPRETTFGDNSWNDDEKVDFINETYDQLEQNDYVEQIDWWFIGRQGEPKVSIGY